MSGSTNSSPRRLDPKFYERIWGVSDLAPWFPQAKPASGKKFGEAWFTAEPPLPILVKFLFAAENLSVQVHPEGECGVGKTEMWHILRAEPNAAIALGFEEAAGAEELREAALNGRIERMLHWHPVSAGETYFIPAGTIHAIGAGVTLCEVQQNSDITYRLYDYGRPRELHLDAGLAVSNLKQWKHPGPASPAALSDGWTRLAGCRHFATDAREVRGDFRYQPDPARFELLICLEGAGRLNSEPFAAAAVWLIPPGSAAVDLEAAPSLSLLRTYLP